MSQSEALSTRLLGIGRRTTMPVQPVRAGADAKKSTPVPLLDVSSSSYHPLSVIDASPSPPSSSQDCSLPPRHQRFALTDGDSQSPNVVTSSSPRGGRLNDLLSHNRSRSSSTSITFRPQHSKQPSASLSSASSSSSAPSGVTDDSEEEAAPLPSLPSHPRALLKQGPLRKRSPKGLRLWQSRYLWLYSDALHYGKSQDSRTLQGRIPLAAVKFVMPVGGRSSSTSPSRGCSARFDVVVGESTIQRAFHFEARDERDADEWVRHISQAVRALSDDGLVTAASAERISGEDKFWKVHNSAQRSDSAASLSQSLGRPYSDSGSASTSAGLHLSAVGRRRTDGLIMPPSSRLSTTSYVPTNTTPSLSALPVPPSPSPMTPLHAAVFTDSTGVPRLSSSDSSAEARGIERALEIVEAVEMHRIGRTFLCRERARPDVWHLLQAVPRSHPLAEAARTAHGRMAQLHLPHLLTPLCHSHTSDAVFAVYTPALRPVDLLLHYLTAHRRLPEAVVKHVAVHVVRALGAQHGCGYHYRALSPTSLAFDGDGAVVLTDPLFSLGSADGCPVDPEYQLPGQEGEAAAADWWRLGVLLYELAVGLPPVRPREGEDAWKDVAAQLASFHPLALPFPSFVSSALQSLIRQLLMLEADSRLGCGEAGEAELRVHEFFADVDWESESAAPAWVRQYVQRQAVRPSLSASTVSTAASASCTPPALSNQPITCSAFTFSPVPTPRATSKSVTAIFPPSPRLTLPSAYEAYLQQKPPRHLLLHPPPPSSSPLPPTALRLTILGGRNFPPPHQDASVGASSKRRTLDARSSMSLAAVATHGVFIAVGCGGELRVSRMVVGVAACQPQFGDEMTFALSREDADVELEVKWGRIGSAVQDVAGHSVGSASVSVADVQALCGGGGAGEIWHSVIDAGGLVVGELHVRYVFDGPEQRGPWWVAMRTEGHTAHREKRAFAVCFGVQLEEAPAEETAAMTEAVKEARGEGEEENEASGDDVRVHLNAVQQSSRIS